MLIKPIFYYITEVCSSNSTAIKENFLLVLHNISEIFADAGYAVDTVEVTCGPVSNKRKKREAGHFQYEVIKMCNMECGLPNYIILVIKFYILLTTNQVGLVSNLH